MALAWNTRKLLAIESESAAGAPPTPVEFHLLSHRELYDNTIVTVDRRHSSAGTSVALGEYPWYAVTVVTRPTYALPQELCLSFGCFSKTSTIGFGTSSGPPIEDVANEFAALLSLLAREPIVPLGTRRIDRTPIRIDDIKQQVPRSRPANGDSRDLRTILIGLASASDADSNAVLAACRLYHAALSLSAYDVSTAYFSLVAAIECIAGHHLTEKTYAFDKVEKFKRAARLLDSLAPSLSDPSAIKKIKSELLKEEHFVWQKFRNFVEDFLPSEFWSKDELHPTYLMPTIERGKLRRFLRQAYDARSAFAHAGTPFPAHVEAGIADRVRVKTVLEGLALQNSKEFVPVFPWFERLTHSVIVEYLCRVIAPELVTHRARLAEGRTTLLTVIKNLPDSARQSLEKLTRWTAQFVDYALVGPMAPNNSWASDEASISLLGAAKLIGSDDTSMNGKSWLLDREVGEAVGEFFYGAEENPFRGCTILAPSSARRSTEA